ncbi:unnamed protein product [Rodentolepis nana]|uniref:Survival of motor neuron-related-splicing factor 30 n=1 Tax=Rodentolepis nana TaxID=102285 RepID=A0A0R3TGR4_RODNA|nr:unnamed protein product [Rodentolepis nana]
MHLDSAHISALALVMDELRLQLVNNRLQLQQVEASLKLDKGNEELKMLQENLNSGATDEKGNKEPKNRKEKLKKQKRAQHQGEMVKAIETEKNEWLNFSKKYNNKHKTKRSIFASPENVDGKVGVGTCGISGRPMTKPSYHRLMRT